MNESVERRKTQKSAFEKAFEGVSLQDVTRIVTPEMRQIVDNIKIDLTNVVKEGVEKLQEFVEYDYTVMVYGYNEAMQLVQGQMRGRTTQAKIKELQERNPDWVIVSSR